MYHPRSGARSPKSARPEPGGGSAEDQGGLRLGRRLARCLARRSRPSGRALASGDARRLRHPSAWAWRARFAVCQACQATLRRRYRARPERARRRHGAARDVSRGQVDVGFSTANFWAAKVPAAALFGGFPFGPDAKGYVDWFFAGNGRVLYQELRKKAAAIPSSKKYLTISRNSEPGSQTPSRHLPRRHREREGAPAAA